MNRDFETVFAHFHENEIAIVGSSLRDFTLANDLDVLFPASVSFRQLAANLGIRYLGGWLKDNVTYHQLRYGIRGVDKPVNLIQRSDVEQFTDYPHATLLRTGELLRPEVHFRKP